MHLISYHVGVLPLALWALVTAVTLFGASLACRAFRRSDRVMAWRDLPYTPLMLNLAGGASILTGGVLYKAWMAGQVPGWTSLAVVWLMTVIAAIYGYSRVRQVTREAIQFSPLDPARTLEWKDIQDYAVVDEGKQIRYIMLCNGRPEKRAPLMRFDVRVPAERYDEFEKIVSCRKLADPRHQRSERTEEEFHI